MELTVLGPGDVPLLPISWDDLKAVESVLKGYLAYVRNTVPEGAKRERQIHTLQGLYERVVRLLAKGEGALLFSAEELMALKEAISGFAALIMWMVPQSSERDGVIESLQGLYGQFARMLAPFVN
jgi:hypothetical protein